MVIPTAFGVQSLLWVKTHGSLYHSREPRNKNKRIISSKFWLWLKNNLYEIDANKIAFLITQS